MSHWKFLNLTMVGLALTLPGTALAKEVSEISEAQASEPKCSNAMQYQDLAAMPLKMTLFMQSSTCKQCASAVKQAVQGANSNLQAAKGQDQSINASTSASTASKAAATGAMQKDTEFKNGGVNNDGGSALTQQQQLAQGVSGAMNSCAQQINSACSSPMAQEDKADADKSAQSCQKSSGEAQQVAGEKGAKAGEMAKNEAKSNDNGQKMGEMPQMPQMGGGGDKGGGASTPSSSLSGESAIAAQKAAEQKLESSKFASSSGKSGLPMFDSSGTAPAGENETTVVPGGPEQVAGATGISDGNSGSSGKRSPASGSSSSASTASGLGVTTGGSGASMIGGSSGSGGTTGSDPGAAGAAGTGAGTANAGAGDAAGAMVPYSGSSSSYVPLKSAVLGLSTDGEELKDFVAPKTGAEGGAAAGAVARNGVLHDRQGGLTKAINEQSLFHRISFRLRRISADRTMQ